ncbi:MAG TPA: family 43 glycosylhydrolase, partial [Marinagarivorans sp.]
MSQDTQPECWQVLPENAAPVSQPLVKHVYTADPSAHVFNGKIYIYPSHDIDAGIEFNDNGDHFAMCDYHVFSMDESALEKLGTTDVQSQVVDHGVALHVDDVPWASRQMWAPDAAHKDGVYYFYFPARNHEGMFQIGVASASTPEGPFTAEPLPIEGSYSIDPAVFQDGDDYYLYFGGLWGGQLQCYRNNTFGDSHAEPEAAEQSLNPLVARLSDDMKNFAEAPRELVIVDENGEPLLAGDER